MSKRKLAKKRLVIEGILAVFLAISPILFYSYKYIPVNSDNTWSFLGITFTDNGYDDITIAFYFYLSKLIPLALLVVWFLTSKNWWYHIILIPIAMYAFQLYGVFSEDAAKIDENELYYLLVVCMVVVPIVYFIRVKLFDKYVHGIDLEAMEAELKALKEKQGLSDESKSEDFGESAELEMKHSLSDKIDEGLSTRNLSSFLKQFRHNLQSWF